MKIKSKLWLVSANDLISICFQNNNLIKCDGVSYLFKIQNYKKLWSSHYWIFVLCLHVTNILFLRFSDGDSGKVGKITITHTEKSNLRVSDYSLVPVRHRPPWKYCYPTRNKCQVDVDMGLCCTFVFHWPTPFQLHSTSKQFNRN